MEDLPLKKLRDGVGCESPDGTHHLSEGERIEGDEVIELSIRAQPKRSREFAVEVVEEDREEHTKKGEVRGIL